MRSKINCEMFWKTVHSLHFDIITWSRPFILFSLKPKKVKYPTRQLYISAKQGELQKVIHLLGNPSYPRYVT